MRFIQPAVKESPEWAIITEAIKRERQGYKVSLSPDDIGLLIYALRVLESQQHNLMLSNKDQDKLNQIKRTLESFNGTEIR